MKLNFRFFVENQHDEISADIPLSKPVHVLSDLFAKHNASLYVVGGAVRDYLYAVHHGGKYSPKDFDVATELPPDEVMKILESPDAKRLGIKAFPKGLSFGVVSAVIDGEEIEIATFREDGDYSDGRRPDSVKFSTPSKDAQRRDLNFNALFYDIQNKKIIDYNLNKEGKGQGLEDIKNLVARPVGNARDRFREDKLRIPRLIRFFSRFNPGEILQHMDKETLEAIEEFKELIGVSPERISAEFITGLNKSINPINYLKNYEVTGLIPAVFPGLKVDLHDVQRIGNIKNIKPVLAWLLKSNDIKKVRDQLNKLKYSNDIADSVVFLMRLLTFNPAQIAQMVKQRDLYKQLETPELQKQAYSTLTQDVQDLAKIAGLDKEINHFMKYQPQVKSQDYMHLPAKDRGSAMSNAEMQAYQNSKINGN